MSVALCISPSAYDSSVFGVFFLHGHGVMILFYYDTGNWYFSLVESFFVASVGVSIYSFTGNWGPGAAP